MGLSKLAKKVRKQMEIETKPESEKFIDAIDKWLVRPQEPREQRLAFRPSQFHKCQRLLWYFLNGKEEKTKRYPRSERILQVGTALHEWIQNDVLMKMSEDEDSPIKLLPKEELPAWGQKGIEFIEVHNSSPMEVKFLDYRWTKEIPVSAMVDGALEFNNVSTLFEFKTINPDDFKNLIEPKPDHTKQGVMYALCTGVRRVMFLYMCKGTQNLKAYLNEYTDEQIEWAKNRLITIEEKVLNGELPEKEVSNDCRWCGFKYLCDKDG